MLEVNPGGEIVWSLESDEIRRIRLFWITQLRDLWLDWLWLADTSSKDVPLFSHEEHS